MPKRKGSTVVQEVTFVRKKKRRGGQKLQVEVVPGSPATPASSHARSMVSTPAQSPSKLPALFFHTESEMNEQKRKQKKKRSGSVCIHSVSDIFSIEFFCSPKMI
jgi:hypothetical protein